ncbi:MAG: metal-sensitive transcriptional regulator [Candidatus Moranbacteria bacterium]|jgi:DNA-binding FrmR family transcriptional regulator|nr:metal-sensitive transcriptional regulator [Candidatus Moranbacteria bacterium]MBP9801638.1 metal-sensitive transcriptional regulator [Candidatus Moranbacteria bacterium]
MIKTVKTEKELRAQLSNRIARIEGQLNGIHRMIQEEKECMDIIIQISAVRSAISNLGVALLKNDLVCKQKGKKIIDESYLKMLFKLS